jgi:predicted enzyme related to lactoylglutathione lyase
MLDLVVLRAREPQVLASFYSKLGLHFCAERHGNGPEHMACDTGRGVVEIYPYTDPASSTRAVRLGFRVTAIDERCLAITATGGRLLRAPRPSPWGKRATIEDPEGHIIDLVEEEVRGR